YAAASIPAFRSFFFKCPRPHRDRHSFPTRRSSDLSIVRNSSHGGIESDIAVEVFSHGFVNALHAVGQLVFQCDVIKQVQFHIARSEEHTSELQSRFDLVCRLLLEKKKKHSFEYVNC